MRWLYLHQERVHRARKRREATAKAMATRRAKRAAEDRAWDAAMSDLRAQKNAWRASQGLPPLPEYPSGFGIYPQQAERR